MITTLALINKKAVRKNKAMKKAQKAAKKRYGRVRMNAPRLQINKVAALEEEAVVSFIPDTERAQHSSENRPFELSTELLIGKLDEAGLCGLSGGGFSTAEKLRSFRAAQKAHADSDAGQAENVTKNHYLIVNGVECEPGLLHDEWILTHAYAEVQKGIEILQSCFHFDQVIVAAKNRAEDLGNIQEVHYIQVPNRFPMGQENLLIKTVLGIELEKGEVPAQNGILVMNLQTVLAVGRIMTDSPKKNARYLTVANLPKATAVIAEAPMGMPVAELAKKLLPAKEVLYVGGGAMNVHVLSAEDKVDATTAFLACGEPVLYAREAKCKGCGGCTAKCPGGVDVRGIIHAMEKGRKDGFEAFHPEKCIGCGSCSYVCAAGKNTMEIVAGINEERLMH